MRAKLCGITHSSQIEVAIKFRAWALGFNCCTYSPRYLSKAKLKRLVAKVPKSIIKVAVIEPYKYSEALYCIHELGMDYVQVYTHKTIPRELRSNVIYALSCGNDKGLAEYSTFEGFGLILLDAAYQPGQPVGGTGRLANWSLVRKIARDFPVVLAGGLSCSNIRSAIEEVNPFAVDVASGIEKIKGIKDTRLMKKFMEICYEY
jgi:phosphoribosylanthranilate isomerase